MAWERREIVRETIKVALMVFDRGAERGAERPLTRDGLVSLFEIVDAQMMDRETVKS